MRMVESVLGLFAALPVDIFVHQFFCCFELVSDRVEDDPVKSSAKQQRLLQSQQEDGRERQKQTADTSSAESQGTTDTSFFGESYLDSSTELPHQLSLHLIRVKSISIRH
jgi:hypothetical protein